MKNIFYYQNLLYIFEIICYKIINSYYNNPLADHFGIKKTKKFIASKYFWLIIHQDIKAYIKDCNICLASKTVCHKLYENL